MIVLSSLNLVSIDSHDSFNIYVIFGLQIIAAA